jgi:hypothetical protein
MLLSCLANLDRSNPAVITQVCEWHHGVGRLLPYLLPTQPLRPADALAKRGKLAAKTVLNRAKKAHGGDFLRPLANKP